VKQQLLLLLLLCCALQVPFKANALSSCSVGLTVPHAAAAAAVWSGSQPVSASSHTCSHSGG
jgi:hypothetical protein